MIHKVKCLVCGNTFDRDKEAYVAIPNSRRYAHEACYAQKQKDKTKEERDKEALETYIKKLFCTDRVPPRAQKQIKDFVTDKQYTYSGILKSLKYFYEIKGGSLEKANGGIGIVPFVYENAYRYYYAIWLAEQQNEKILEEKPSIINMPQVEIHITSPKRKPMGRQRLYFSFLDEELREEG